MTSPCDDPQFQDAVAGFIGGDFSRLDPLFDPDLCKIVEWHKAGCFDGRPKELAEALSCACFNGRTAVAEYLMDHDVDPTSGDGTGMDGVHWAVNRGQLETVRMLIRRGARLDTVNMHGGTPLDTALWSAIHEPRPDHPAIIEALKAAGAKRVQTGDYKDE